MRRIILSLSIITVGLLTTISFMSCKDKDGVYKPKEKISKIYYEDIRHYPDTIKTDTTQKKELLEVWKWNKNKLTHIEKKGSGWAMDFVYDGKQVIKIESGESVFNFIYDSKDLLEKIEALDENGLLQLNVLVSARSNDKITKLTYQNYSYTKSLKQRTVLFEKLQTIMNIMVAGNFGEDMHKNMVDDAKRSKATTITTTVVDLAYEGNNVGKETWTYENVDTTITFVYTYDTKVNPFYRALNLLIGVDKENPSIIPTSENNILTFYNQKDPKKVTKYEYKYDSKDFPTERLQINDIIFVDYNHDTTRFSDHKRFYYEYEE